MGSRAQINLTWTLNAGTNITNAPSGFRLYRSTVSATAGFALVATINTPTALSISDRTVVQSKN